MEIDLKLMDMHNHTIWSDGVNTTQELVEDAITKNIKILGFTDHFNTSKCPSLRPDQLEFYIKEIETLQQQYGDSIEIFKGVEINSIPYPKSFKSLPYDKFDKLDYVLIEYLEFLSDRISLKNLDKYINKFQCQVGLAHTDLFSLGRKHHKEGGLDYILDYLEYNNIFLEINSNLAYSSFDDIIYYNYNDETNDLFKKLSKRNIKITVGSDKHSIDDFALGRFVTANRIAYSINSKGV